MVPASALIDNLMYQEIQTMKKLRTFIECASITSIKEINDKYNYKDEHPNGHGDPVKVACGQSGSYNELEYIYEKDLEPKVNEGLFTQEDAIRALCTACHELESPRSREDFYKKISEELETKI